MRCISLRSIAPRSLRARRWKQQLTDLRQVASSETSLIKSDSSALAEAQVQTAMKSIVENNQGEVRSAQPLPPSREGNFEVIAVNYD